MCVRAREREGERKPNPYLLDLGVAARRVEAVGHVVVGAEQLRSDLRAHRAAAAALALAGCRRTVAAGVADLELVLDAKHLGEAGDNRNVVGELARHVHRAVGTGAQVARLVDRVKVDKAVGCVARACASVSACRWQIGLESSRTRARERLLCLTLFFCLDFWARAHHRTKPNQPKPRRRIERRQTQRTGS